MVDHSETNHKRASTDLRRQRLGYLVFPFGTFLFGFCNEPEIFRALASPTGVLCVVTSPPLSSPLANGDHPRPVAVVAVHGVGYCAPYSISRHIASLLLGLGR